MMSELRLFDLKERIYSIALDFRGLNECIEDILMKEEYNVGKIEEKIKSLSDSNPLERELRVQKSKEFISSTKVLKSKTFFLQNYLHSIEVELRKAEAGIELLYSLQREQLIDSFSED